MGFVLLWIESLAVSLLLVATLVACICRSPRRTWQWVAQWAPPIMVLLATCACMTAWWQLRAFRSGFVGYFDPFPLLILLLASGLAWLMIRPWLGRTPVSSWGLRALALLATYAGILGAGWLFSVAPLTMSTTQFFTILAPILCFTFLAAWLLLRRQRFWVKVRLLLLVVAVPPLAWLSCIIVIEVDQWWHPSLISAVFFAVGLVWMICGRVSRRAQVGLSVLAVLLPLAAYAALAAFAGFLQIEKRVPGTQFHPLLTLTIIFAVGASWTAYRGLRRGGDGSNVPAASGWPRAKLGVALGVAVVLHLMTFWNLDLAIRQELATLRAEAGALAQSVAPARVPDRDNAGLLYQQAFEAMGPERSWNEAWDEKWNEWLQSGKADFDPKEPRLREFLDQQTPTLVLLREAAAKPGCYFDRDYGRPSIAMLLPEASRMRAAARLLAVDARCKAADGDMRGALENTSAIFAIAEHAGSEPILLMTLVAIAIDTQAKQTLEAVLASGPASAEDLAAANIHGHLSHRRLLARAVRMEEAFGHSILCGVGGGNETISSFISPGEDCLAFGVATLVVPLYRVFLLTDDVVTFREIMNRCGVLAVRPYYEVKNDWKTAFEELKVSPQGIVTRIVLPPLNLVADTAARGDAQHGVARLGLAAYRYRAAHGEFPDKLEDLSPELIPVVPRDPFDGKPMRLKQINGNLVVYSIGPDMADDGGVPLDNEKKTGDITFELSPP